MLPKKPWCFPPRNRVKSPCGKWQGYIYTLPSATLDMISKNATSVAKKKWFFSICTKDKSGGNGGGISSWANVHLFIVQLFTWSYLSKSSDWASRKILWYARKSLNTFLGSFWIDFQKETLIFAIPEWDTSSSVKPPNWVAWFLPGFLGWKSWNKLLNIKTLEWMVHNPLSPLKRIPGFSLGFFVLYD